MKRRILKIMKWAFVALLGAAAVLGLVLKIEQSCATSTR